MLVVGEVEWSRLLGGMEGAWMIQAIWGLHRTVLRNYARSEAIAAGGQTDDFFECLLVHVSSLCIRYLVVCPLIPISELACLRQSLISSSDDNP